MKMKNNEAGDAPQLCPDGEPPQGKLQPAPNLKGQGRAMCKLLHLPAVILTQNLQGQGQSQRKGLISEMILGFRLSIWRNKCWYLGGKVESGLDRSMFKKLLSSKKSSVTKKVM